MKTRVGGYMKGVGWKAKKTIKKFSELPSFLQCIQTIFWYVLLYATRYKKP